MRWIDTEPFPALPNNLCIVWDRSISDDVGVSVSEDVDLVHAELRVAVRCTRSSPIPAPICFFHPRPKPLLLFRKKQDLSSNLLRKLPLCIRSGEFTRWFGFVLMREDERSAVDNMSSLAC